MKTSVVLSLIVVAAAMLNVACEPSKTPQNSNDFAVLAQQAEAYTQAKAGRVLRFPRDHGPHPDYRIEWWYLTANLTDTEDRDYGIQWTLFRLATEPQNPQQTQKGWLGDQLFMAHMAITTPSGHVSFQRYARGGENHQNSRSGVIASPFSAWLDDWVIRSTGSEWLPLNVKARQDTYAFELQLKSDQPPVLQGDAGYSQKHADGGGSHYYSQPFLQASGQLTLDGQAIDVSGDAWLDREWGSQFLQRDQVGWDWFSLHLDNGEKLMLFQLREQPGKETADNYLYGTLMKEDGTRTQLDPLQIQMKVISETRVGNRLLPLQWSVNLPQVNRYLTVTALHPDQWMDVDFPYWEGVVKVTGEGGDNQGKGYMELTGYAEEASGSD